MDVHAHQDQIAELSFEEIDAVSAGSVGGQVAGAGIVVAGGVVAVAGAPFIAAGIVIVGIITVIASGIERPNRDGSSRIQQH